MKPQKPAGEGSERETVTTESTQLSAMAKVEIDQQVTTARAYPRSLRKFLSECMEMATLNERVASECFYALPRDGKTIAGPSARLAEIVASAWGNCRAGSRVVDEGPEFITAQGVFHDLERNVAITYEVRRRITDRNGRRYGADMIGVTGNAACSIALRNAVFKGVPKAFWSDIYEASRKAAVGDIKTLATTRAEALAYLQKHGVSEAMVLATLGLKGIEDIGLEELATLKGLINAIREGDTTIELAFAAKEVTPPTAKGAKPATSAPKGKTEAASPAAAPPMNEVPVADLLKKIDAIGVPVTEFCAHFEIGTVADLPLSQVDHAWKYLNDFAAA